MQQMRQRRLLFRRAKSKRSLKALVVVKHRYIPGRSRGGNVVSIGKALAHVKYIQHRPGPDKERGGREMFDEKVADQNTEFCRLKMSLHFHRVFSALKRRENRCIGGRASDPQAFEFFHRWLGVVPPRCGVVRAGISEGRAPSSRGCLRSALSGNQRSSSQDRSGIATC